MNTAPTSKTFSSSDNCEACGSGERAMIFQGQRWCSDTCRKIIEKRDRQSEARSDFIAEPNPSPHLKAIEELLGIIGLMATQLGLNDGKRIIGDGAFGRFRADYRTTVEKHKDPWCYIIKVHSDRNSLSLDGGIE